MPPAAFRASRPAAPSQPAPESTTPIARTQEVIDWRVGARRCRRARSQPQSLVRDLQLNIRWYYVQMVPFNWMAVRGRFDRHRTNPRKDFGQIAVALRIEMLNKYECQTRICWQVRQEKPEGFQTADGGPDSRNRYCHAFTFLSHQSRNPKMPNKAQRSTSGAASQA